MFVQRATVALTSRIYQLDVGVTAPSFAPAVTRQSPQPNVVKTFTVRAGTDELRQRAGLDNERVAQNFTPVELLVHGHAQVRLVPDTVGSPVGTSLPGHVGERVLLGTHVLGLQDVGVETVRAKPVASLVQVEDARGGVFLVGGKRLQVTEGLLQAQLEYRFRRGQLHFLAPERHDERFLEVLYAGGLHVQVTEGALPATGIRVAVAVDLRRPSGQGGVTPVAWSAPTSP